MSPIFIAVLVVIVLGAGGYYGYISFFKSGTSTPLSKPAVAPKPSPSAAPAPAVTASEPVSLPGQMIDKAKKAVDAHTQSEVAPVNEVVSEEKPAAPAPSVSVNARPTETPPPAAAPVEPPPAPSAPQTVRIDLNPADAASPEFKAFISNLRVSGVFQGEHPRVLIGSRTYEVGETVNDDLGVVFAGIDSSRELALFKDRSGVTLVKKY
ncbi:MAG TPA: hypothetical protein VFB27_00545 [Opitutaceae bacterium]|nr:hypothetical protein [Opitutaceae bacterium]